MTETTIYVDQDTTPAVVESEPDRSTVYATVPTPQVRREVIPEWMRDRTSRRGAARTWWDHTRHWTAFHAVRIPLYALRLSCRAPVGLFRVGMGVACWTVDAGGSEARAALIHSVSVDSKGTSELYRTMERHRQTVHVRLGVLAAGGLAVLLGGHAAWTALSGPGQVLAVLSIIGLFGVAGRRHDRPVTDNAASTVTVPRLSSDLIVAALSGLGLGKMNTALRDDPDSIKFVSPIQRSGKGWRADIDLPVGVTAGEVIDRRASLASGLRRPLGSVWPAVDPDVHEGRLVLYVADRPLSNLGKVPWPLMKTGKANVFEPIPLGVDQRGEPVSIVPMYASGLIGAVPRMGKTFILRLVCLGAALDPRTELHIYNLKGGADFEPLGHVAHAYRAGDDPEDLMAALKDLRELQEDMRNRYRNLKTLPRDICPESKVTDELASRKGFHPILIAVDECQIWFEHPEFGKEFEALATDLVKRGPAVGIMVWFSTQRPDKNSIPTGIRDNAVLRLCLKVTGHDPNDMVLGTGMYKAGYRATVFSRKDMGIAILAGEDADPRIVRAAYVDNQEADRIAVRARAAKVAAGRLTGLAAGQDPTPDTDTSSILDHLLSVWPAGQDKVWCETLADRLADRYPDTYSGWTGEQVTATVKPHGLSPVQIKRSGVNRRGLTLDMLTEAMDDRTDTYDTEDTNE